MNLPVGLESLTLGQSFNQSLEKVRWPSQLITLTCGNEFNQTLTQVTLPNLQNLTLVPDFSEFGGRSISNDSAEPNAGIGLQQQSGTGEPAKWPAKSDLWAGIQSEFGGRSLAAHAAEPFF